MTTLTETELLILNSIIYEDSFSLYFSKYNDTSIYAWALQFKIGSIDDANKPAEISSKEFSDIINTILNNPQIYRKMRVRNIENETANPKGDGTQKVTNATITYNDNLIVLYKGTGGDIEWQDNGEGAYSNVTDTNQQRKALDYFDRMIKDFGAGKKIYTSGHSKGANKAMYVAILRGAMIEHAYAYDGQGFGKAFWKKYEEEIAKNKHKITNISNANDFVNILLGSVAGTIRYIKSSTTFGIMDGSSSDIASMFMHKLGGWHSPYSMFTFKDGNLVLDEDAEQGSLMREMQGLIEHYSTYMDDDDLNFFIYTIMSKFINDPEAYGYYHSMPDGFEGRLLALTKGYVEHNKGVDFIEVFGLLNAMLGFGNATALSIAYSITPSESYALLTRDFSDEVKQQLLNLVQEVDEEPWYDMRRWDILYRVEQFFDGIDFPGNAAELNTYYRKLIDIQATSREQIHAIFR